MKQTNASKGFSVFIKPDDSALNYFFYFLFFFKFAYSLEHIGW